ncbi:MAG: integrase arm-type DNA-binding domain-containing protein [Porticoccaceae bacterium]|nr:integrase arm-type DNA-binding domain-containing protein [Pseudomonadales bacterium]
MSNGKLTATAVKQAKPRDKDYKLFDGGGLFLQVRKDGAKYWRLKYRYAGKEKLLAIGVYPDYTLAEARDKREKAKRQLRDGIDPSEVRRANKMAQLEASENSFEAVALEWFNVRMKDKSESHKTRTLRLLKKDLFPYIGRRPVDSITAPELLAVLRKIESRGAIDTAHRAKQTAGQVFRYAIVTGRAERDSSADLQGALTTTKTVHHAAITDPKETGRLMLAIDAFIGTPTVKTALQLSPLVFTRPGELRRMEWMEIDWEALQWEIPAEKMKMREPLIVPLSKQAITLLKEIHPLNGRSRYVFPSARGANRPMSDNAIRVALRTMGYDNNTMTPHGFRAMARTLLDEVLGFRVEWIEQQLAHAVKDANGRAYNRTTHLKQRREMMQKWADYLDNLKREASTPNVIAGNFG